MSPEDRAEFDELMLAAGADAEGKPLPSREIGPRVLDALTNAADNAHRAWADEMLADIFTAGCLKRWKDWNRGRAVITVAGESYVTTKAAAMSVLKKGDDGAKYFQLTFWEDMTRAQLAQILGTAAKRADAEKTTMATARRLMALFDKAPAAVTVREAAAQQDVDIDDYLGTAEAA
jgi:hypothetical protein